MTQLKFVQNHKSIKKFASIELADFSIITGLNGSGKTHLLDSILNGNSIIDDIPVNEIKYFDFKTFFIENEQSFNNQQLNQEKIQAWNKLNLNQSRFNFRQSLVNLKNQLGSNYEAIVKLAQYKNKPFLRLSIEDFEDTSLFSLYKQYREGLTSLFNNPQIMNDSVFHGIKAHAYRIGISLDSLSEREFKDFYVSTNLKNDFLPTQLSKIFLDYKQKEYVELIIKKAEAEHYGEEVRIKDEKDFQKVYAGKRQGRRGTEEIHFVA